jgi:lambda repressor-like predicted transcriptional regulator
MTAKRAQGFRQGDRLTEAQAEALTAEIRGILTESFNAVVPLIVVAFKGRAWAAMEYTSWDEYCRAEFAGPRMLRIPDEAFAEIVAALTAEGMSVRAISSATGASVGKVHKSRPKLDAGAEIISLDEHASRRKATRAQAMERHPAGKGAPTVTPHEALSMPEQAALIVGDRAQEGTTVHELCEATGWAQGTASCALSRAAKRGLIAHSGHSRGGAGLYFPAQPKD